MIMKPSSKFWLEALDRAVQHWKQRRDQRSPLGSSSSAPPGPIIAISRENGAQGAAIARKLGEKMGWAVYDRELLDMIANNEGVRTELLEGVDERQSNFILEALEAFVGAPTVSSAVFIRDLVNALFALAAHGECVVVGRGAAQILPAATTLRVRIVAPLKLRVARVAEQLGLTQNEAARRVEQTDRRREEFVKANFHKDAQDVHLYDLVINSARYSQDQCAELIINALQQLRSNVKADIRTSEPCQLAATAK
jgi:cytidylate kinase